MIGVVNRPRIGHDGESARPHSFIREKFVDGLGQNEIKKAAVRPPFFLNVGEISIRPSQHILKEIPANWICYDMVQH